MSEHAKKNVAIIGSNGLPGRYGGWDQLMEHLTKDLGNEFDFDVYTSKHSCVPGVTEHNGAKIKIIPLKANGIQSIPYDIWSLLVAMRKSDVLLILGTSGCISLPFIRLFNKNIILNIDGAEWNRGKWNTLAKAFLKFSERVGVKYSSSIIADNPVIAKYVLDEYDLEASMIPYGGDHVLNCEFKCPKELKHKIKANNYAFKVARIEPENSIDQILEAFSQSSIPLVIVGNWKNSPYGINLRSKYQKYSNLYMLDPIYDQPKLDALRSNCALYIHGHSVGGTNPSLVEAMHLGLCVLAKDVSYNRSTTGNMAQYFATPDQLRETATQLIADISNQKRIGANLKKLADNEFTWQHVCQEYKKLFLSN